MNKSKAAEKYLNKALNDSWAFMDTGQNQAALNAMREYYKQALSDVYGLIFQFGEVSVDNLNRLFNTQYPTDELDNIELYKNMSGFISRQPNGLYCRFRNVTDFLTDINMTADDYIQMCVDKWGEASRIDALETLDYYVADFSEVLSSFVPNNMSVKEFRKQLKEIGYDGEYKY